VRERAEIAWGRGKAKVVIEAALDLGHVIAGKQKEEICELELELREGEPAALLELAAELAENPGADALRYQQGRARLSPVRRQQLP
jgi:inorganic triphosphatase YgiF